MYKYTSVKVCFNLFKPKLSGYFRTKCLSDLYGGWHSHLDYNYTHLPTDFLFVCNNEVCFNLEI